MRKLRVLVLMHEEHIPPESLEGYSDKEILEWKAEYDVCTTLEEMGHEVRPLGLRSEITKVAEVLEEWKPHIAFNLLEEFHGISMYNQYVIGFLELQRFAYTGCNPRGLMLTHDKALHKKILSYHRIHCPKFTVFPMERPIRKPARVKFPLLVKSLTEDGSFGIAQSSIVSDFDALVERVEHVHGLGTHAIAEEYIEGREIYVAVLGNRRLQTLPILELVFGKMREGAPLIATSKVKWDWEYQKKHDIKNVVPDLPPEIEKKIIRTAKRIYRSLSLSGYARIDLRLTEEGEVYVLEANPNPDLSYGEEISVAAEHAGMQYEDLLQRIINLGLAYQAEWKLS